MSEVSHRKLMGVSVGQRIVTFFTHDASWTSRMVWESINIKDLGLLTLIWVLTDR